MYKAMEFTDREWCCGIVSDSPSQRAFASLGRSLALASRVISGASCFIVGVPYGSLRFSFFSKLLYNRRKVAGAVEIVPNSKFEKDPEEPSTGIRKLAAL